jgi:hypothetical protein
MEIGNLDNNGLSIQLSLESLVTNRFALTVTGDNYLNIQHEVSLSFIKTDGNCFHCIGANCMNPDPVCTMGV